MCGMERGEEEKEWEKDAKQQFPNQSSNPANNDSFATESPNNGKKDGPF